jgi:hypothetical protein
VLATRPNELWSWDWDITKLLGPQKWTYFYLYVILDVLSPGWFSRICGEIATDPFWATALTWNVDTTPCRHRMPSSRGRRGSIVAAPSALRGQRWLDGMTVHARPSTRVHIMKAKDQAISCERPMFHRR